MRQTIRAAIVYSVRVHGLRCVSIGSGVADPVRLAAGSPLPEGHQPCIIRPTVIPYKVNNMRPTTEEIQQAPDAFLFPPEAKKKLTAKQRKFARQVAIGATKADAYRSAYDVTSQRTMAAEPYRLAANPIVAREIEAIQAAISAQEYQTPAALRALVISSLVKVITDPDSKPGQITAAAKVLGTVTEVAAFTERKEVRTISSSEDARARVLEQLRSIVKAEATDATMIEQDAESLLAELAPHREGEDQAVDVESLDNVHTIPLEQSPLSPDSDPTPSSEEHPPS